MSESEGIDEVTRNGWYPVEQPSGVRNHAQERAAERIGKKAARRAERKLPVSGSEESASAED